MFLLKLRILIKFTGILYDLHVTPNAVYVDKKNLLTLKNFLSSQHTVFSFAKEIISKREITQLYGTFLLFDFLCLAPF